MWRNLVKLIVAALAIGYLVYDGRLELDKMKILYQNPFMVAEIMLLWILIVFPIATLRFKLFLMPFAKNLSFSSLFSLTMIGNFFNSSLPGMVSGDVIKGYYLNKQSENLKKTDIVTVIAIDRIVGVIGLIIIGVLGLFLSKIFNIYLPKTIFLILGMLLLGSILFYGIIFVDLEKYINKLIFKKGVKEAGFRATLLNIISKLHAYSHYKMILLSTLLLSCAIHISLMLVFFMISQNFYTEEPHIVQQMVVIPPGLIAVAVPISPSGIGIGHAGFEALYHLVGLKEGANIFNIFIILQILTNLLGVIPYLIQGKKIKNPA